MSFLFDWAELIARWLHVMAGIAWIGTSFYFNWFDSLVRPNDQKKTKENNRGTLEEIHGGSFYYHEQYWPDNHPENLLRHSWPAKTTLLTGLFLLVTVYWVGASSYLVDKEVLDISPTQAVLISFASLVFGWVFYRGLCKITANERVVFGVMFVFLAGVSFFYTQVFGSRAAFVHTGVFMGTLMGLNVWLVIVPNHIAMTNQLRNGEKLNTHHGYLAKRVSQHNNYFTLPVVFTMVSNHFAFVYGHPYAWVSLAGILYSGWAIRYFLNIYYKTGRRSYPTLFSIGFSFAAAIAVNALSINPVVVSQNAVDDAQITAVLQQRCTVCHANQPSFEGFVAPPLGMVLENIADLQKHYVKVKARTVIAKDMPIGNLTNMTQEERSLLASWIAQYEKGL